MMAWRKPKADYVYNIRDDGVVHITDLNYGNMSVTNDVENVIWQIHKEMDLTDRKVVYTDSEGNIDQIIHNKGEFIRFSFGDIK